MLGCGKEKSKESTYKKTKYKNIFLTLPKKTTMSKVQNLTHIVFNTKNRKMTITNDFREDVYRFIWNECKKMNCYLVRINGIPNHIHILVDINPSIALSDFVKKIKQQSSNWMKECGKFPDFEGWGREYGAFSVSESAKSAITEYIIGQQEHHNIYSFEDEYKELCSNSGLYLSELDLT